MAEREVRTMETQIHKHTGKHAILMLVCCLAPIAGIVILAYLGVVGSWGYYGLILLCPLGHFVIMSLMNRNGKPEGQHEQDVVGEGGDQHECS